MNLNATLIGQLIAFALFVWFCMKFVWPPIINAIETRQSQIANALASAEAAKKEQADTKNLVEQELLSAKVQAQEILDAANKRRNEVLDEVKNHKGLKNVTKIVYVDASYSTKKIDVNNTFIRFNYDKVATLSEIPLLADRISLVGSTNQYFYLYFETNSEDIKEISEEREILKNSIVNILKTKALQKN